MTIEFHCPYCQKLLKTADDKAGVHANCPGCGQAVTVPDLAHEAAHADASLAHEQSAGAAGTTPDAGAELADEGRVASAPTKVCPMCGETILDAATRCRFCGENLGPVRHEFAPTRVDVGDVLSRTWEIYKQQIGLLLGSFLVQVAINFVLGIVIYAVFAAVLFSVIGARGMPGANPVVFAQAINIAAIVLTPLAVAINAYFDAGLHLLYLRIARGERAEITDMFAGGRFYWRVFLANLVFSVPGLIGNLLQLSVGPLAPWFGVFVQLVALWFYWPCLYVIVDRDVGVLESFRHARELANINLLATVAFFVVLAVLSAFGVIACCVGWIFTIPAGLFQFAVAYCAMSGQPVVGARTSSVE